MSQIVSNPEVREITSPEGLIALEPQWQQLWGQCPTATPFQSPHWLIPWCRSFNAHDLMILTIRRNETLVGLAPFYIYAEPVDRVRKLLLMGTGNSDYLDAIFAPMFNLRGATAVFNTIACQSHRWDRCELHALRNSSILLAARVPSGIREELSSQDVCPVLKLVPGATLEEVIPPSQTQRLRYHRHRLERAGAVSYERADAHNFEELMAVLVRLHTQRWRAAGQQGVLATGDVQAFLRDTAWRMLNAKMLRLAVLRLDGRPIAALCAFTAKACASYYLGGFDPHYARLSPGTLIIGHAIERAIEEGCTRFDFLRGSERYKYAWGAGDHALYRRVLTSYPVGDPS